MNELNAEKKTFLVIVLTVITMAAEIVFGYYTHSMALFADGWHMGTHALALSLTFFTYVLIRKFANTKEFVFGTGKFGTLSGFASSLFLGLTGLFIIGESIERFFNPLKIGVNEAIIVAIIGLVVNVACILIMSEHGHEHGHCKCEHEHCACGHDHCHNHEDFNFKAAYMHILADAMTSIFAIIALIAAKYFAWTFLDPIVGFIGGLIICSWAFGLIKKTSMILLDAESKHLKELITEKFKGKVEFEELHVWQTSEEGYSLIGTCKTQLNADEIKPQVLTLAKFDNIVIEIKCIT